MFSWQKQRSEMKWFSGVSRGETQPQPETAYEVKREEPRCPGYFLSPHSNLVPVLVNSWSQRVGETRDCSCLRLKKEQKKEENRSEWEYLPHVFIMKAAGLDWVDFVMFTKYPLRGMWVLFTFPPTVQEGSLFSTPFQHLLFVGFLMMAILTDWCEVILHCSFDLHFSVS